MFCPNFFWSKFKQETNNESMYLIEPLIGNYNLNLLEMGKSSFTLLKNSSIQDTTFLPCQNLNTAY